MSQKHSLLDLKIPPLVVVVIVAGVMWLASRFAPGFGFQIPARGLFVSAFVLAGFVVSTLGFAAFRRVGTTLNPMKPETSSALVTGGIYQWTRNPMYLGFFLVLLAWAMFLANSLTFLFLPIFILYMNRFQIEPEEKALAATFGREFLDYMKRVRRWI